MKRPRSPRPRPVIRTQTEAQSADDARVYADNRRVAARRAFRVLMMASHGCTGKDCASPDHAADLNGDGGLMDALRALEIIPDPKGRAKSKSYHWGEAPKGESA